MYEIDRRGAFNSRVSSTSTVDLNQKQKHNIVMVQTQIIVIMGRWDNISTKFIISWM